MTGSASPRSRGAVTRFCLPSQRPRNSGSRFAKNADTPSRTSSLGLAIITESALSYLGLGIGPPIASWGSMLFHAQEFIWEAAHYALFPGAMILVTVLCVNFIGDGLRDAFDPRSFER